MKAGFKKLIVALDVDTEREVSRIVKSFSPYQAKFKVGSIAFAKFGPALVRRMVLKKCDVFVDLKFYDIPNTMAKAAGVLTGLGCWAFTVHVKAGQVGLRAVCAETRQVAKKYKLRKPLVLGVTELTSSDADKHEVMRLAKLAASAGLDGVVSSAWEAKSIKRAFPKLKVVTPGIRGPKDVTDDQKRVATAKVAFANGADYIVVGRPIVAAKNYVRAARDILGK